MMVNSKTSIYATTFISKAVPNCYKLRTSQLLLIFFLVNAKKDRATCLRRTKLVAEFYKSFAVNFTIWILCLDTTMFTFDNKFWTYNQTITGNIFISSCFSIMTFSFSKLSWIPFIKTQCVWWKQMKFQFNSTLSL